MGLSESGYDERPPTDSGGDVLSAHTLVEKAVNAADALRDAFDVQGTEDALDVLLAAEERVRRAQAWLARAERLRDRRVAAEQDRIASDPSSQLAFARCLRARFNEPRRPDETLEQAAERIYREERARRAERILASAER